MRKIRALALFPFALTMIGADDCNPWSGAPPNAGAASGKPFCNFDPPVGCRAFCIAVDTPAFTGQCGDVGANTLTKAFQDQVSAAIQQAEAMGAPVCPEEKVGGAGITPCALGIAPQPNPPEDQSICQNPLPGCVQY